TEEACGVLALDAVDDEVCDEGVPVTDLIAQRAEVARRLLEGQRFGNRDEDEARARRVEEHGAHALDAPREVAQEEVNFVLARAASISRANSRGAASPSPLRATSAVRSPTFASRLSESECAGSVEKRSTASPSRAASSSMSAVAAAAVVFPTPPLPPKKM